MRYLILLLLFPFTEAVAQRISISGEINDSEGNTIPGVNITLSNGIGTASDSNGEFNLNLSGRLSEIIISFSHINYYTFIDTLSISDDPLYLQIVLLEKTTMLDEISITEGRSNSEVSLVTITPKSLAAFPSPSPDISRLLVSLPGVISNNELSTSYSVRGGSFDENLIFVDDIPIYKPQIASNGQQEGLGFVNLSMVGEVSFSSGGWSPEYGDKLSSVMNIRYKKPQALFVNAMGGLLGGHLTVGSAIGNTSFIAGIRHKNTRYLLNSLETEGEYLPKFTDIQLYSTTAISPNASLTFLGGYARNRYEIIPTTRETEFGTFTQAYRLTVGFEGRDILSYDTYQGGIKLEKSFSEKMTSALILSAVKTLESEYTEVEGGYRLCDVNKNIGSASFNECAVVLGIGTLFDHRRNYLNGVVYNAELKNQLELSNGDLISGGISWNYQSFTDRVSEYNFTDSAGYVTELHSINALPELDQHNANGYLQLEKSSGAHEFTIGARVIHRFITDEFTLSPRFSYSYNANKVLQWKFASGIYRQLPVYREYRGPVGQINNALKMQASWHIIAGMDRDLTIWERPFKLVTEVYYKYLWNVNPYEVDNVRIRYFANNNARAYATGADFRLSGEFIKNTESWFSLGFLSTKENVEGDGKGFIRRPMDQRMTMAIFFQDHLPNNPSFQVNVHVQIGSGLPFGPPNDVLNRNTFRGDAYRRVDIGFSKVYTKWSGIDEFIISAEILNLTGSRNVISYTWINDVYGRSFAVPNTLSARFLNIKLGITL